MIGLYDTWQTQELGYQLTVVPVDIGGPMNLGEEYRWNLPLITYGFDESFLNYFGTRGVDEVEKAIKILNDLPPFSQMSRDLSEYPLDTRRVNHRGAALYLLDLKSFMLSALLEQMGLAAPERYTWTLRSRVIIGSIPAYTVIKRNFDPVTWEPTPYVNGTLYTYLILQTYTTPTWEAVEFEVDPSLPSVSSVAGCMTMTAGGTLMATGDYVNRMPGLFVTGLTRDDVGGLRYIYRSSNINVESLATNTLLAAAGTRPGNYILEAGTGSPWSVPGATNAAATNLPPVDPMLREGIDKFSFVRVNFDSMTGAWNLMTNVYQDYYVTNSVRRTQLVQRTLTQPDILFAAGDLGITIDGLAIHYQRTAGFVSQDTLNGLYTLAGPGVIRSPITMTISKLGMYLWNFPEGGEADALPFYWWGSYDGTTNEPVVYPSGASIKALERLVLSGRLEERPNPWRVP